MWYAVLLAVGSLLLVCAMLVDWRARFRRRLHSHLAEGLEVRVGALQVAPDVVHLRVSTHFHGVELCSSTVGIRT